MEFLHREELPTTTLPIERPVTPLRMLNDMAMRAMGSRTQHGYVRHVRAFAGFLGRSPDTATAEDVRRFQLHQREYGVGESVIGATVSALRFLFGVTLDLARRPRKLPDILSVEEVGRLLEAAPGIEYRAALAVAYGAGLRVSEGAHLKADDIDSKRMLIRIEEGKGRKDRDATLSPPLIELLRLWWREGKRRSVLLPHGWLFPGRSYTDPISRRQLHRVVHEATEAAISASASARTRCGIVSRRTCWSRTSIFVSSRCCSGTASSKPPRSTPRSRPGRSAR